MANLTACNNDMVAERLWDMDVELPTNNVQNEQETRTQAAARSAFPRFDRVLDFGGKYWFLGVPGAVRVVYGFFECLIGGFVYPIFKTIGSLFYKGEEANKMLDDAESALRHYCGKGFTDMGRGFVELFPGGGALIACLTEEAPLDKGDVGEFAQESVHMDALDPAEFGLP